MARVEVGVTLDDALVFVFVVIRAMIKLFC
jgi:hypothetical protein